MPIDLNTPFSIGPLTLPNRLIQGPLAGFSCAPFRELFYAFTAPAYCVSEMISAHDVIHKHSLDTRYLYRSPVEKILCYQISGNQPSILAQAAQRLEALGANLIDINCGCPKTKIRKKGAGSALLQTPELLLSLVHAVREAINIPLTVKIRIQDNEQDIVLAKAIQNAGADALIVHGRYWDEDYDVPCRMEHIAEIKKAVTIPVIANGDIQDATTLNKMMALTHCDAYMISRAGTGKPWLYQQLLTGNLPQITFTERVTYFVQHLHALAALENEYCAVLQSRRLVRYYFKNLLDKEQLQLFYQQQTLAAIIQFLSGFHQSCSIN